MEEQPQVLIKASIILIAATLLFVVLFPYTPTPVATTIGKILIAAIFVFAFVSILNAAVVSLTGLLLSNPPSRLLAANDILNFICVRLR